MEDHLINLIIGQRVREMRVANKVKQETLANQLGMARASLISLEAGKHSTPASILIKIARIFKKQITDLLPLEPSEDDHSNQVKFKSLNSVDRRQVFAMYAEIGGYGE